MRHAPSPCGRGDRAQQQKTSSVDGALQGHRFASGDYIAKCFFVEDGIGSTERISHDGNSPVEEAEYSTLFRPKFYSARSVFAIRPQYASNLRSRLRLPGDLPLHVLSKLQRLRDLRKNLGGTAGSAQDYRAVA